MTGALLPALVAWAASAVPAQPRDTLPPGFPTCRGTFAFANAQVLAQPEEHREELQWLSQFEVILTNGVGIASPETRDSLQRQGCKLFLYFWMNGFYAEVQPDDPPSGPWCQDLVRNHSDELLSAQPLPSVGGYSAYYFDFANEGLVARLCRELTAARTATGYDGLFFDYAGAYGLAPEALEAWQTRHPELPYDRAVLGFLKRLRETDPNGLLFTNQAYRAPEPLAAEVDYDLAESYGTSFLWGPETKAGEEVLFETYFRDWPGDFGLQGLYGGCEKIARQAGPRRDFLYLDYAQARYRRAADGKLTTELDLEAIYYSYCAAALWGRRGFCSGWYAGHEYRGPLYFADLGRPLGDEPKQHDGVVLREYERGLVALLTGTDPVDVRVDLVAGSGRPLHDLLTGESLPAVNGQLRLQLAPARRELSGALHPVGRVYLKAGEQVKQ